ncbi:MAG: ferric reductase-like transmembrane domain-containing protein [Kaiparowitsia implicata GSE-PSE-MK54-09C]|nr:ferric reductase-like transmembrane domain-containing protein [Kaiparowitsia implicata GSE-PSE-MK54-09C]
MAYTATLLPSILRIVFPRIQRYRTVIWLMRHRRLMGLFAFSAGLGHGLLMIMQRNLNLLRLETYFDYISGFLILLILAILSVTSPDWARRKLKSSWKKIHQLTYLLMLLIPGHILYTMSGDWSYMTHIELWSMGSVIVLFLRRKHIERRRSSIAKHLNASLPSPSLKTDKSNQPKVNNSDA